MEPWNKFKDHNPTSFFFGIFLLFGSIMRIYNIFFQCNEKIGRKYQISRKSRSVVLEIIPWLHYADQLYQYPR